LYPTPSINDGAWHHIAVTFDRSSEVIAYVDGINVGAESIASVGNIDNTLDMVIGADSEFDYPLNAFIDEVCVYNKALSQNEIRERRHLTQKESTPNLISYYQFNESEGKILDRVNTNHLSMGSSASRSTSAAPVGGGSSLRMDVISGGVKKFAGTGVTITFPSSGTYPDGELVVSRINLAADFEPGVLNKPVYFMINNYGSNSSFSTLESIQFEKLGNITTTEAAMPSIFKLFKRNSNNEGDTWGTEIDLGDSASSGSEGSVTFSTDNGIENFSQFVITQGTILPVEWMSFNAILLENKQVLLDWSVATEINNEYYIVERSLDGISFEEIGRRPSLNLTNTEQRYDMIDSSPKSGLNYYRIKQVDFDGTFSYTPVRSITINSFENKINIFPNPVNEKSIVSVFTNLEEELNIELLDANGKIVLQQSFFREGSFSTESLTKGVYFYRVKGARMMKEGRLVIF